MEPNSKLFSVLAFCSLIIAGCGSPSSIETTSQCSTTEPSAKTVSTPPAPKAPSQDLVQPQISKVESAAKVQVTPLTTRDAIAVINLLDLPRLNQKIALVEKTTFLDYEGQGTLAEADSFYKKLFGSDDWKEIPSLSTSSERYIVLLFQKSGQYLRACLSVRSDQGDLGIMLENLGNVDVRSLPRLPDADDAETPSSPINVNYVTKKDIPDAADALLKLMTENGWQLSKEFQPSPIEVPHYRDFHFRKEACRVNVGIVKNPSDKTCVFYHAEHVTPFDIPTPDSTQPLKLDLKSNRASFAASSSRKELVSVLRTNSQKFGWEIGKSEKFEAGEEHMVPINVTSGAYIVARLIETEGKYFGSIENFASAPLARQSEPELVVDRGETDAKEESSVENAPSFDELNSQMNSAIQNEISKAPGSLNSAQSKASMEIESLQAMANRLANRHREDEKAVQEEQAESAMPSENPFDVPEDAKAPGDEILSIRKSSGTLKYGRNTFKLEYVACYVVKEMGEPVKCIFFSDRPFNLEKMNRHLLTEGKPIYGTDVSDNATNVLQFRIGEHYVSIDAQIGSMSLGTASTDLQTNVFYYQGKLAGKILTTKPIYTGSEPIEFTSQLNEPVIQVNWANRNSPEVSKLVADESQKYLLPASCNNTMSEGSKYSRKIEATIEAPLAAVEEFYSEQLETKGWKPTGNSTDGFREYRLNQQELGIKLESDDDACKIIMMVRDSGAAKADEMLPPPGKAMLVLGNISTAKVQMTIAGKSYQIAPSDGRDPKDATKVVVEPGAVEIQINVEKETKKFNLKVDATTNSTWGVVFDTGFQGVLRLY